MEKKKVKGATERGEPCQTLDSLGNYDVTEQKMNEQNNSCVGAL